MGGPSQSTAQIPPIWQKSSPSIQASPAPLLYLKVGRVARENSSHTKSQLMGPPYRVRLLETPCPLIAKVRRRVAYQTTHHQPCCSDNLPGCKKGREMSGSYPGRRTLPMHGCEMPGIRMKRAVVEGSGGYPSLAPDHLETRARGKRQCPTNSWSRTSARSRGSFLNYITW